MANIKDFNLINTADLQKLTSIGIRTCAQMVEQASTSIDRMRIADKLNMNDAELDNLTHHCDMMRVEGMTHDLAVHLCGAGVCTVPKLAYQSPSTLHQKLTPLIVERPFLEKLVASAKKLPKIIRH